MRNGWRWLCLLLLLLAACNDTKQPSGFVVLRADRRVLSLRVHNCWQANCGCDT